MLNDLNKKQKHTILILLSILLVVIGISYYVIINSQEKNNKANDEATITDKKVVMSLDGDKIISSNNQNSFNVKLKLSHLPSNIYSSASFSIYFEKDKVEFIDIDEGDILTFSSTVPKWKYDVKSSNKRGQVNIIYLDSSGAKESFTSKSIKSAEKNNILILKFKLKENIENSDEINFKIKDAVFATIDGDNTKTSLSINNKNMKTNNLKIKIQ